MPQTQAEVLLAVVDLTMTPAASEDELAGTLDRTVVVVRLPVKCCRLEATLESHFLEGSMTAGCRGAGTDGSDVLGRLSAAFGTSPS